MNRKQFYVVIALAVLLSGCTSVTPSSTSVAVPQTPTPAPTTSALVPTPTSLPTRTSAAPTVNATPSPVSTTSPTLAPPPTPVPPANEWATFVYTATRLSFKYPANWFTLLDSNVVYVSNFRVDALYLKGHEDEKIKITIELTPTSIDPYDSLDAYLNSPKHQVPPEQFISQEALALPEGYQGISEKTRGMGDATLVSIFVAKGERVIGLYAFDGKYIHVIEQIVRTVRFE